MSGLPMEPTLAQLPNPVLRYLLATRPAFLSITLVGCLLGATIAWSGNAGFNAGLLGLTLLLALLAHAGVNVFNDYYDHLNGTDARNTARLFPFTGGSRFIQNGVFSPNQIRVYASVLFGAVVAGGVLLIGLTGAGLFWIGLFGLLIGWAYSAPPLRLNSRGLGELAVLTGFLLVVVGADFVQRGAFDPTPWLIGLPYAVLTTNILYINQFPDRQADLEAGKRHWVARLAPARAAWGYSFMVASALFGVVAWVWLGVLPNLALVSALFVLPAIKAALDVHRCAAEPSKLRPAIQLTILAAHLQPVLLVAALVWEHAR